MRFITVLCMIFLFCQPAAATEYPWEKAEQPASPAASPQKATPRKSIKLLKLGPYVAEQQSNWIHRIDPEEGEMLVLVGNQKIKAAIVFAETLEDTDYKEIEPHIVDNVEHIDRTHIQVAGKKDVLCLRDVTEDNETLFHLYPYKDRNTMYWLYVADKEKRYDLRPEVIHMLKSLRFR